MSSRKIEKLLTKTHSSSVRKKVKALVKLETIGRTKPCTDENVPARMVKLLLDQQEEVRDLASKILLRQSEFCPQFVVGQTKNIIHIVKNLMKRSRKNDLSRIPTITVAIKILGNIEKKYPKLGGRIAFVVNRALRYPLFRPQDVTNELNQLYIASIQTLGVIGVTNLGGMNKYIPHICRCLRDSYKFDFWKKEALANKDSMRGQAITVLKEIGKKNASVVIPHITPGLNVKDREVANACKNTLLFFSKEMKNFLPSLMESLAAGSREERRKVTEFIVVLGKKEPENVIPLLGLAILDRRDGVRRNAALALVTLLQEHSKFIPAITPNLVRALLQEKVPEIKEALVNAITVISFLNVMVLRDHIPAMISTMNDEHHFVRLRMVQVIKNVGLFHKTHMSDAIPRLIAGLDDFYTPVRQKCSETLDALKVNKYDYLNAMKKINNSLKLLENSTDTSEIQRTEAHGVLKKAIEMAKKLEFAKAAYLSTHANNMLQGHEKMVDVPPLMERGPPFPKDQTIHEPVPPPPPFGVSTPTKIQDTSAMVALGIDEIFLMTSYGILIEHFVMAKKSRVNEEILAGMLVAVKSFMMDSFDLTETVDGKKMNLNNIDFGDFSLIVSTGNHLIIVAITTDGDRNNIFHYLSQNIVMMEEKYLALLKKWDGDMDKLREMANYMKEVVLK